MSIEAKRALYTDLKSNQFARPGALGSKQNYKLALRQRFGADDDQQPSAEKLIHSIDQYTRHREPRWRFPRRTIASRHVFDVWQADTAYLTDLTRGRQNDPYLLVVVDSTSRYVYLRGMRKRTAEEAAKAMADIFREAGQTCKILFTDRGTEYQGAFAQLLLDRNVEHFLASGASPHKAALSERKILQVKKIIYKYMTSGERTYRALLPKIQDLINSTPSPKTLPHNWTPKIVQEDPLNKGPLVVAFNEQRRFEEMKKKYKHPKPFSFRLNDLVRVQQRVQDVRLGRKSARGLFSQEKFVIAERLPSIPHTYRLNDVNGERLAGERVYSPELVRATNF